MTDENRNNKNAIVTKNLCKMYEEKYAIKNLNIRVPYGAICGFLGCNGAGKTTTIKILLGLIHATEGQVKILGSSPGDTKGYENIGAMVEGVSLYDHLSGRENLNIFRILKKCSKKDLEWALEVTKMSEHSETEVSKYSLGMKQRLALSIAIINKPKLLILDEPTNGLDPQGRKDFRSLITYLSSEHNTTIFLSSHILNEIEQISTDVIILNKGEICFQGKIENLLNNKKRELVARKIEDISKLLIEKNINFRDNGGTLIIDQIDENIIRRILIENNVNFRINTVSLEDEYFRITELE